MWLLAVCRNLIVATRGASAGANLTLCGDLVTTRFVHFYYLHTGGQEDSHGNAVGRRSCAKKAEILVSV